MMLLHFDVLKLQNIKLKTICVFCTKTNAAIMNLQLLHLFMVFKLTGGFRMLK